MTASEWLVAAVVSAVAVWARLDVAQAAYFGAVVGMAEALVRAITRPPPE